MPDFPLWQQGVRPHYPPLEKNASCDAVIVGGGLTGITTAAMLSAVGVRIILLEGREIGCGASFACTGKVTAMQPEVLDRVRFHAGQRAATAYGRLLTRAVDEIRSMVESLRISCAYMPQEVLLYARTPQSLSMLHSEHERLRRCGVSSSLLSVDTQFPLPVSRAAWLTGQARLMPLPYMFALAEHARGQGCVLHEHTPVLEARAGCVRTSQHEIRADTVILATGFPMKMKKISILALTPQHMLEERVLTHTPPLRTSMVDVRLDGLALLPSLGGIVATCDLGRTGARHTGAISGMDEQLRALLPGAKLLQRFFRADVFPVDGLPLVGECEDGDPRLLMACGYSGWGMTGSFLAARVLSKIILKQRCPEASLLSPHRRYRGCLLTVLRGSLPPAGAWLRGLFRPGAPVCPHMGCRLHWDDATRRWECPCHGSCFDELGMVVRAPAAEHAEVSIHHRHS